MAVPWPRFVRFTEKAPVPAGAFVDFENDGHERITALVLSSDLFDRPRAITIDLKRPETFVRPADVFGKFGFCYHALLSRRIQYSELPRNGMPRRGFCSHHRRDWKSPWPILVNCSERRKWSRCVMALAGCCMRTFLLNCHTVLNYGSSSDMTRETYWGIEGRVFIHLQEGASLFQIEAR